MATEAVPYGIFVHVRGKDGAFGVVNVVNPLVVDFRVPEFADAFDVFDCLLLLHVCVEEPGSCVVGELTEEVLGFIGCAR